MECFDIEMEISQFENLDYIFVVKCSSQPTLVDNFLDIIQDMRQTGRYLVYPLFKVNWIDAFNIVIMYCYLLFVHL